MRQKLILFCTVLIFNLAQSTRLFAQIEHPVHWSYAAKKSTGHEAEVFIKATINESWHIYATDQSDGGPVKTSLTFEPSSKYNLLGLTIQPKPITMFEDAFKMNVRYFEGTVIFHQKVMLSSNDAVVRGKISFMVCNHQKCLPPDEVNFRIPVK
jgi:hypothetical protein